MYNYEKHDNAPRMEFVCDYLKSNVFFNVIGNISGYYPIQLHDSYTYLQSDAAEEREMFCFAKHKHHRKPVLLPDPYMMGNYGGRLEIKDSVAFQDKTDTISFYGVTTGDQNPVKNERIRACEWSLNNADISDFKITGIVQMDQDAVIRNVPSIPKMMAHGVPIEQMHRHKYLLSMDGNTASYDRPCWIMNSKSLLFKYASPDILWYYPLLREGQCYMGVENLQDIRTKVMMAKNNPNMVQLMVKNANDFVNDYLKPINRMLYTTELFEIIASNR